MTALRRFKPYPAYKNSGVEWLREIPTHWCRRFKSPLGTPSRQPFDADDTGVGERPELRVSRHHDTAAVTRGHDGEGIGCDG